MLKFAVHADDGRLAVTLRIASELGDGGITQQLAEFGAGLIEFAEVFNIAPGKGFLITAPAATLRSGFANWRKPLRR